MSLKNGLFIISLDFELFWGIHDENYSISELNSLKETRKVVLQLIELFLKYNIHVSFSTVGFLFAKNKKELFQYLPKKRPSYTNTNFSAYHKLEELPDEEDEASIYYASTLLDYISKNKNFEIGTHTFSHYYGLEDGQNTSEFNEDLIAAKAIASTKNITIKSIIFPRNQYSSTILDTCKDNGIICYRGNENSWVYKTEAWSKERLLKKGVRFLDSFFNLTGHHGFDLSLQKGKSLINLPSSRFLRPYNPKLSFLNSLKLRRIKRSMTHCAKHQLCYHLWWHPHNFRKNSTQNFQFLEEILKHFLTLKKEYHFKSQTMEEAATLIHEKQ